MSRADQRQLSRAEKNPIRTAIDFVELALLCDAAGKNSPLQFLGETVVSCLEDDDLQRLHDAVWCLQSVCEKEQQRRERHGVLPRPTPRLARNGGP